MAEERQNRHANRRDFLKLASVATGASAVALVAGIPLREEASAAATAAGPSRNDTLRMVADVRRALDRPVETRRWGMVIDARRCIGCHACTAACIAENVLSAGVSYRTVPEAESGSYPKLQRFFMPTNCMQCERAPCIDAANAVVPGSMTRRPDGIVTVDYVKMKGRPVFEAAKKACPYEGALYFDEGRNWTDGTPAVQPYEKVPSREYGREWSRNETKGATRKCHFCIERIESGMLPACVATCTGQAMHFGDLADGQSLVAERISQNKAWRLENGAGTSPRVFYLEDSLDEAAEITCRSCHE